jgi:hypothetical protein
MAEGGYRVIKYPVSSAISKKKIVETSDLTRHLIFPVLLKQGVICFTLIIVAFKMDVVTRDYSEVKTCCSG